MKELGFEKTHIKLCKSGFLPWSFGRTNKAHGGLLCPSTLAHMTSKPTMGVPPARTLETQLRTIEALSLWLQSGKRILRKRNIPTGHFSGYQAGGVGSSNAEDNDWPLITWKRLIYTSLKSYQTCRSLSTAYIPYKKQQAEKDSEC